MIEDKNIVYRDYVDISVAVATPKVCPYMCIMLSNSLGKDELFVSSCPNF